MRAGRGVTADVGPYRCPYRSRGLALASGQLAAGLLAVRPFSGMGKTMKTMRVVQPVVDRSACGLCGGVAAVVVVTAPAASSAYSRGGSASPSPHRQHLGHAGGVRFDSGDSPDGAAGVAVEVLVGDRLGSPRLGRQPGRGPPWAQLIGPYGTVDGIRPTFPDLRGFLADRCRSTWRSGNFTEVAGSSRKWQGAASRGGGRGSVRPLPGGASGMRRRRGRVGVAVFGVVRGVPGSALRAPRCGGLRPLVAVLPLRGGSVGVSGVRRRSAPKSRGLWA